MTVTRLACPGCGAPAPAASGSCGYCGATLQIASPAPVGGAQPGRAGGGAQPGRAGGRESAGLVDVVLRGLDDRHVPVLVEVLGRPPALMAQVPSREPPVVFGVPAEQAARLRERLAPLGIEVELRPSRAGGPGGPGPGGRGPGGRRPGGR